MSRRTGFTLVEILMVVVILGIAAAAIVPQMGSRDDLKLSAAARALMADLSYAQSRAITKQRKHYLQFGEEQYTLLSRATDAAALAAITHPINPGDYVVSFASGPLRDVRVASADFDTRTTLVFDELGSPMSYNGSATSALVSPGTIRLESGTSVLTMQIEPYTGEITLSSSN
ncbi:MAG TPA: GspH/FimT family pseudopilin [Tepidisphaeraceae bacterium]|jgi:type II secretion system protein H